MLLYVLLYLAGVLLGVTLDSLFAVQLRRPGLRQAIGLTLFLAILWGVLTVTHTPFTDILLLILWAGTGLMVGLGSRTDASTA